MSPDGPIRVLVVDDSPTARALIVAIFGDDPRFRVVGQATNGAEAILQANTLRPDLISMDVQMPVVDGLEATKEIMRQVPTPIIIVSGTAATDVSLALNAMQAGALTVLSKPSDPLSTDFDWQRVQLVSMANAMAGVKVVRRAGASDLGTRRSGGVRRPDEGPIKLVAIGTSTGGPAALHRILLDIGHDVAAPIVVVQHMSLGFIPGLADWLGANTGLSVSIASEGELFVNGAVYLAPDGAHLGVTSDNRATRFAGAAIGGFRPAVDYLFDSAGRAFGTSLLAVILTGMGQDGVDGLRTVKTNGGLVLAQDEATSVVFGMALQAITAGLVDEVLPLDRIGGRIAAIVKAEAR